MRIAVATAIACLSIVSLSTAADVQASIKRFTNIPAQGLGTALQTLAKERKFQVVYVSEEINPRRTDGAVGELTAEEALARMLKGTGLTFRYLDEKTVTIVPIAPAPSAAVTPDSVSGGERRLESAVSAGADARDGQTNGFWSRLRLAQNEQGQAADKSAAKAEEPQTDKIQEIVVTAQKREENLQDVPISLSVLGGDALDSSSLEDVRDALSRVAGISALETSQGGGTQLAVRGVSSSYALFFGSSTVAYYLDSVPFGFARHAAVPDANPYDLDRVEVLRGPQGTLYGASALNGVVRVLTKDPNVDEFGLKARTTLSSTEDGGQNYRGDLALNVPLMPGKLAARAVLGYDDRSGWIDKPGLNKKDVNDGETANARFKIKAQPTDDLSVGLSAWLSREDYGAPAVGIESARSSSLVGEPGWADFDAYGLTIDYDFQNFSVSSATSYLEYANESYFDFTGLGVPAPIVSAFNSDVWAQEIVLSSTHEGPWRWTLGGMYRDNDERLTQYFQGFSALSGTSNASKSFAVFGEAARKFLDGRIELAAGARYFEDDERQYDAVSFVLPIPFRTESTFDAVSPRVVLTWHPGDQLLVYASYAEGFRSGLDQNSGVLGVQPDFAPLDADTLTNYELGSKGTLWNGRVSYETAVFYIDWQDVQESLTVLSSAGVPVSAQVNGESASGLGLDFSLSVAPNEKLTLGVNAGWNDLVMDSAVFSGGILLRDKGERFNYSPEYTVGAWADYDFPLGASGFDGRLSASANYTSSQIFAIVFAQRFLSEGEDLLVGRASLAIDSPEQRWRTTLFVDNVTNEEGPPVFAPLSVANWSPRIRPRTIGVQLEYRFGK